MLRSAFTRWIILGGALLATVVASVWPKGQESRTTEVVRPASERERASPRQPPPLEDATIPAVGVLRGRQNDEAEIRDLFGPKTWNTPPPRAPQKPSQPAPPPAPMAPLFPYSITGKVVDANGTMIVFANQNQHFAVRAGELLEQTYRVDAIDSQTVTVTYLPLGLTQRLPIGESN